MVATERTEKKRKEIRKKKGKEVISKCMFGNKTREELFSFSACKREENGKIPA